MKPRSTGTCLSSAIDRQIAYLLLLSPYMLPMCGFPHTISDLIAIRAATNLMLHLREQVRFYQANFEHASSEANMEVRDAHNVEIFVSLLVLESRLLQSP